jgi:S1-C subfamily serine protease
MNWEKSVVKINVILKDINYGHPLNNMGTLTSTGTGFFISKKLILTCYHVVKFAINIEILYKQTININAKIKHILPDDDIAIIEIQEDLDNEIIDMEHINHKNIDNVLTVGFPLSSTNIKITKGIISGYQESLIQTDAGLNPGNSGGPLIINSSNGYKIIGVNVSKMGGTVEKTGYIVPIYRFTILKNIMESHADLVVIKKPTWIFDYQKILQNELRRSIFGDDIENKIGVIITILNKYSYLNTYLKVGDILLSINNKIIDSNGRIKFDFYPEKISLSDINIWFCSGDIIRVKLFRPSRNQELIVEIILQNINTNLMEYYGIINYPEYYIEKNGLILSIITSDHIENLKYINLSFSQILKIINRRLYCADLFTVYLSDLNFSKLSNFIKYPVGEIIIEINDTKFTTYNEFMKIINNPINKIKTIDNDIYFITN